MHQCVLLLLPIQVQCLITSSKYDCFELISMNFECVIICRKNKNKNFKIKIKHFDYNDNIHAKLIRYKF